jgi:hypothetical protein
MLYTIPPCHNSWGKFEKILGGIQSSEPKKPPATEKSLKISMQFIILITSSTFLSIHPLREIY